MSSSTAFRTHQCGELRSSHVGTRVQIVGWVAKRRNLGSLLFLDVRDRYGITQVVLESGHASSEKVRAEYVVQVSGIVKARKDANPKLPTGEIEVWADAFEVLTEAEVPPFVIEDETDASETLRFKYRYLDLRRPSLQQNLMVRHKMLQCVRNYLDGQGFVDVETPILYKTTPEGARDFLVPSRIHPNEFYALPQSPQSLKQLLMISGMDRYYQVARCFRDEDLRADRQPEFSQIDIEMSFIREIDIQNLVEGMITKVWSEVLGQTLKAPFRRMSYDEAMNRYGSDKPDLRFDLPIEDVTAVFSQSQFQVFKNAIEGGGVIRAIVASQAAEKFSRKDLDELQEVAKLNQAKGLLWIKVQPDGTLNSPAAKFFSEAEMASLKAALKLKPGDLVVSVSDARIKTVCDAMGGVRLALGQKLGVQPKISNQGPWEFLWVERFPLLEFNEDDQRYYACHHPFTSPCPEDMQDFMSGKRLSEIKASAYDLVLNGVELGGGSLRIFDPNLQAKMFETLGFSAEQAKRQFGFFMEALKYGTPPHGGVAFGVDRLAAMLCGVGPIRDVMAFPKTQKANCPMSDAPSPISQGQWDELKLRPLSTS